MRARPRAAEPHARRREERIDHRGIELRSRSAAKLGERFVHRQCLAVRRSVVIAFHASQHATMRATSGISTNACSLLGVKAISFRFRSVGSEAAFQVDDVCLDPCKSF